MISDETIKRMLRDIEHGSFAVNRHLKGEFVQIWVATCEDPMMYVEYSKYRGEVTMYVLDYTKAPTELVEAMSKVQNMVDKGMKSPINESEAQEWFESFVNEQKED